MNYPKLLLDYAKSASRWDDYQVSVAEKRLRWLKDEAFGNSAYKTTEFNIRRSHIGNRNLQLQLEKDVTCFAKWHGVNCKQIELNQKRLYKDQIQRDKIKGSRCLDVSTPRICEKFGGLKSQMSVKIADKTSSILKEELPQISQGVDHSRSHKSKRIPTTSTTETPYTEATDFAVYRHYFDPLEQFSSSLNTAQLKGNPFNTVGRVDILRVDKNGKFNKKYVVSTHQRKGCYQASN